jgi:carbamoyltransferase
MIVLGINAYHGDASACIFIDNQLIAAAEEERFTRIKHSAGFPVNAIKFCLDFAKLNISEIDNVAINRNPKQKIIQKLLFASKNIFKLKFFQDRFSNLRKINSMRNEFINNFDTSFRADIHNIDHHMSHVASSVYFSGYKDSNFISVDGFGDFASTLTGFYDGKNIHKFNEVLFPHSLGLFYTAITQYLGFLKYGDEYKVMGLAPYGDPVYTDKIRNILIKKDEGLFNLNLKYFLHHTGNVEMTWLTGEPKIGLVYSKSLIELLGPTRKPEEKVEKFHMDIAASAQKVYEEFLFDLANSLYERNISDSLCLSGGCGMNSVANGKLIKNTKYKNTYVPSAPGDSGGAIGAASVLINNSNKKKFFFTDNPYLGPQFSNDEIKKILENNKIQIKNEKVKIENFKNKNDLMKLTAKLLSEGNVIGFFQGRMEWGPRALGNRSIIADPRNPNIRELLNVKIKRREIFRPFAPSILKDKIVDWFEIDDDVPFMSKVFQIKEEKRKIIPAVTHVDGSGRLQSVTKELNGDYFNLINYFNELTNVPIILNTSFNENEPIVCNPKEALNCFLRTKMDYLVMENYILIRSSNK